MSTVEQDIPELKREQLGAGVRGNYLNHFGQGSNVVVLQPEILKAFPTSEAVNKALTSMLTACWRLPKKPGHCLHTPRARRAYQRAPDSGDITFNDCTMPRTSPMPPASASAPKASP